MFVFIFTCILTVVKSDFLTDNIFPSLPLGVPKSDNALCQKESDLYGKHLTNMSLWAHEILDSTAKLSSGVLRGSVFQMGNFDQCLSARAPFPTQYCLATIIANVPRPEEMREDELSLYYKPDGSVLNRLYKYKDVTQQSRNVINAGWCVPASCSKPDLEKSLNTYLSEQKNLFTLHNVTYTGSINEFFCQTKKEVDYFDSADIAFCFVCLFIAFMVLAGTFYDTYCTDESGEKPARKTLVQKITLGFSVRKNFLDLTRADESNPSLKILYGVRTCSIFVIIMDHRFGTFTSSALLNFDYVEKQYRSPAACFLFHGDLFVDTFFILSGLLVTYGLLKQFDKKIINPAFIILLRYIRLTPVYAFVVFYYATLFNHTGSGPLWKLIAGEDSRDCRKNWWTNLLYISNYVNADHMCMTHSWYLPCDFHYFIIAIGLCLLINRQKKLGLCALLLIFIASIIIPFMLTIVFNRPAMLYFYPEFLTGPKVHPDFLLTYSKSHTRATPYFVGMFAGYVYYRLKGKDTHVCKKKSYFIVFCSIAIILVSILTGAIFYDTYHKYNAIEAALYASLHRPAWAIGSIGLFYVASFGHANPLQRILSWSPWIPLSKLVYGAYLIHMQFQLRAAAKFMNPRKIGYFEAISLSLSDMVLAFISALVLYLAIEAPFRNMFKELLMPSRKPIPTKVELEEPLPENIVESMVYNHREPGSRL